MPQAEHDALHPLHGQAQPCPSHRHSHHRWPSSFPNLSSLPSLPPLFASLSNAYAQLLTFDVTAARVVLISSYIFFCFSYRYIHYIYNLSLRSFCCRDSTLITIWLFFRSNYFNCNQFCSRFYENFIRLQFVATSWGVCVCKCVWLIICMFIPPSIWHPLLPLIAFAPFSRNFPFTFKIWLHDNKSYFISSFKLLTNLSTLIYFDIGSFINFVNIKLI